MDDVLVEGEIRPARSKRNVRIPRAAAPSQY
jgi:hypothetical protein